MDISPSPEDAMPRWPLQSNQLPPPSQSAADFLPALSFGEKALLLEWRGEGLLINFFLFFPFFSAFSLDSGIFIVYTFYCFTNSSLF
jgi:hypothetical protein